LSLCSKREREKAKKQDGGKKSKIFPSRLGEGGGKKRGNCVLQMEGEKKLGRTPFFKKRRIYSGKGGGWR